MSIIVSVKINDGIVMAADSATSFSNGQVYEHANKVMNLIKGLPVGVMTCGLGGVGNASIATLLKDLRQRLSGEDIAHSDWAIDRQNYTMELVNSRVHEFFKQKLDESSYKGFFMLRVCGYSSGCGLPEVWQVAFLDDGSEVPPSCVQQESDFGTLWNGERDPLNRLIEGIATITEAGAQALGLSVEQADEARNKLLPHTFAPLIMLAAPIQDAIDLARFLVDTTKGFVRFSIVHRKTVGGPVEIAVITKHEGFKWVQRKHFFQSDLNPT